jgi:anti-anti-sigma regulatory factor
VVQQIIKSLRRAKRDLFIIYISPVDKQLFLDAGFTEACSFKRFNYIEVSVLRY